MELFQVMAFSFCLTATAVTSDVLEEERSSFFGFTHEIQFSGVTSELVQQLKDAVWEQAEGDREVRRYFDSFDAPFAGGGRSA